MLRCPHCGFEIQSRSEERSKVIDSRPNRRGIRRRRVCPKCDERFTTMETVLVSASQNEMHRSIAAMLPGLRL